MFILKALRVEQWVKNLVIFIPYFSLGFLNIEKVILLSKVFFSFSLIVSSTYILNDLSDIDSDKNHPIKRYRPIAAGLLNIYWWLTIATSLFLLGKLLLYLIDPKLLIFSFIYLVLTLLYSYVLKYKKYFDLLLIALLFSIRLFLGSIPLEIEVSIHLVLFIFFTSLGIVSGKKLSILNDTKITNSQVKAFLNKNYKEGFLQNLIKFSFLFSILVYAHWIFNVKQNLIFEWSVIFLVISLFLLILIFYNFTKLSFIHQTEDVIESFRSNNSLKYYIILFFIFAYIGIF